MQTQMDNLPPRGGRIGTDMPPFDTSKIPAVIEPKQSSKFWWGFLLGLPIYPLVMPWIYMFFPDAMAWYINEIYRPYVAWVFDVMGNPLGG